MLRLDQNNHVIFNNSEDLGELNSLQWIESGFSIILPDGSTVFIPEQDCTIDEAEVFSAFHEFYKDSGGLPPVPETEPSNPEPTDAEKIIALQSQIDDLNVAMAAILGGAE